jgi:flavodoxin
VLKLFFCPFSQHVGTNKNTGDSEDDEAAEVEQCEEHTVEATVVGVVAQMSQTGEVFAHGLRSEQVKVPAKKQKISKNLKKQNLCTDNSHNVNFAKRCANFKACHTSRYCQGDVSLHFEVA